MTLENRRRIIRAFRWSLGVHTGFVLVMVVAHNLFRWEFHGPGLMINKILRLVESPVLWAVDPMAGILPLIPPEWTFGRLWVATATSEIILYGLLGGAFYSIVAVILASGQALLTSRRHDPVGSTET